MSETNASRGPSRAPAIVLLLALAALDAFALLSLLRPEASQAALEAAGSARAGDLGAAWGTALAGGVVPWLAIPTLGPLLIALAVGLLGRGGPSTGSTAASPKADREAVPPGQAGPSPAGGLRLLAALQEDARLLDFIREDIAGYSDDQVGSAVRGIHAALRKAIDDRMSLSPILEGEDGDPVEVPAGFDPALVRVTGRPKGSPPFRGVLRHGGWRASEVRLPVPTEGSDASILTPAEVEVE